MATTLCHGWAGLVHTIWRAAADAGDDNERFEGGDRENPPSSPAPPRPTPVRFRHRQCHSHDKHAPADRVRSNSGVISAGHNVRAGEERPDCCTV